MKILQFVLQIILQMTIPPVVGDNSSERWSSRRSLSDEEQAFIAIGHTTEEKMTLMLQRMPVEAIGPFQANDPSGIHCRLGMVTFLYLPFALNNLTHVSRTMSTLKNALTRPMASPCRT